MARPLRVLFFDLETTPDITYSWRAADQFHPAPMLIQNSHLLTWSAKWRGGRKVYSDRLTSDEALRNDDGRLLENLYSLVEEAELIVAHNIDRFDWPKFSGYVLENGLPPLPAIRTIDTVKWARQFGYRYKNLNYLAQRFGLGEKIDTDFDLWVRCMQGDSKALKEMEKYNRHDVELLEGVFEHMLPHVKGTPKLYVGTNPNADDWGCPFCGSDDLQKRGFKDTNAARYQQYQCNTCGKYSRRPSHYRTSRLALRPS